MGGLLLLGSKTYAGVIVGGTRIICDGSKKETSLSVRNPDNIAYLIQGWVDNKGSKGDENNSTEVPFIVTPPLFRLDKGKDNLIRIIYNGKPLPQNKESVFWMNVKSIPASDTQAKNVLQLSIKTRIKLFYRPPGLEKTKENEWQQVDFRRKDNTVEVNNPTPYYISFYSLKIDGHTIDTTDIMVPPLGRARYNLPENVTGNRVSWQFINRFGGNSEALTAQLK